ncbi:hypothetical protein B0H13DRAFT_2370320 [Mycena leptocephala]|nr:hypothetical protein B0H13DRAFT_2370320 [Mycena leptocephala]
MPKSSAAKRTAVPDGKATRNQRSRAKAIKKPGKQSWIHGTKLTFFASRSEEWKAASESGYTVLGTFYTKVTNLYLLKYGYDLKDDEDLAEDTADPTDPDAMIPGAESLSQEDAEERSVHTVALRKKIAAWYCRTYQQWAWSSQTRPAYPFYSQRWYNERVKAQFEARWEVEKRNTENLDKDAPSEIKIRNEVTQDVFMEETEEFKAELQLEVEAEYVAAVRAWELTRAEKPAKTPEELNAALKNAAFYLEPLAEAIREKFGLNCTIMLCGPMGDRGGAIEVRSVHAGTTRGMAAQKWHAFDRMGYAEAEKSMVRFSERCFTEEDCQARVVGVEQTPAVPNKAIGSMIISSGQSLRTNGVTATSAIGGDCSQEPPQAPSAHNGSTPPPEDRPPTPLREITPPPCEITPPPSPPPHPAWDREDWEKFTPEMNKVWGGCVVGRQWGDLGGDCVNSWLNFEAACGYDNNSGQLTNDGRPIEMTKLINTGRKWYVPLRIDMPGSREEEGTFAARWWSWWNVI